MNQATLCTSLACDAMGLLITALQLGQFIPQHYEMAVDKSVVGVSPWLLFFSSLYTYLAALDTIILDAGGAFKCQDSSYRCFMRDQPMIQMIGSAILSITMWYWYLKYHHESEDVVDDDERKLLGSFFYGTISARAFLNFFLASASAFTAVAFLLVAFFGVRGQATVEFAHLCGVLSAVLNALMWIPQIIVTYTFGHKGALSLGWVFASVVMDVAYSLYLAIMGVHWTVWANNVPDGIQTGLLLVMLLRFEYRDRRRGVDDYGHIIGRPQDDDEAESIEALLKAERLNKQDFV